MKKILVFVFAILWSNIYSQSVFRIINPTKVRFLKSEIELTIQRTIIVETSKIEDAIRVAEFQARMRHQEEVFRESMTIAGSNKPIEYLTQQIDQSLCKPTELYGGYNYLRLCSKNMRAHKDWLTINKTSSYNGVHHIINVSTLFELYKITVQNYKNGLIGMYPFEEEFMRNAPGIFHKLHNHPEFTSLFHNKEMQLYIYENYGIKGILDNFFQTVATLNQSKGLEQIPAEVVEGTYLETKLWCDYYGLKWE